MAKKKAAGKARETLVVASKVKDYVKSKGMMSGTEVVGAASDAVHAALDAAIRRCQGRGGKILRAYDL